MTFATSQKGGNEFQNIGVHFSRTSSLPIESSYSSYRDSRLGSLQEPYSLQLPTPNSECCSNFCHVVLPIAVISIPLKRRGGCFLEEMIQKSRFCYKSTVAEGKNNKM